MVCVVLHTANRYHFLSSLCFQTSLHLLRKKGLQRERREGRGEGETCEAVGTIDRVGYKGMQYPKRGVEKRINRPMAK